MSAQHTQGKLKVVSTYAIPEIRDQEDHFVFAAGSASPQSFVNARRLVACWNACEGISTDLLENLTLTGDTIAARLKLRDATERELAAQRDELLVACRPEDRAENLFRNCLYNASPATAEAINACRDAAWPERTEK